MKNLFFMVMALGISVSSFAEKTEITPGAYYAGGAVGTILGLGIGHAVQGRYKEIGWVFTVGEVAGMATLIGGNAWLVSKLPAGVSLRDARSSQLSSGALALSLVGAVVHLGFRVWEIVDLWACATPVDQPKTASMFNKDEGRFAGATQLGVASFNVPLLSYNF